MRYRVGLPKKISGKVPWRSPVWWLPSSRAFIQATLLGLGWTMNPLPLVQAELEAGKLVLLRSKAWEDVPLYWQHWRVQSKAMQALTDAVLAAARILVRRR